MVLAADYRHGQRYTVRPLTLERLAGAARQERRLGPPVLVSGGQPDEADDSLAGMMSAMLQNDFAVPVRRREYRSRNTFENAAFSAEIVRRAGVPSALLVTHSLDASYLNHAEVNVAAVSWLGWESYRSTRGWILATFMASNMDRPFTG
jgi:hypothetical protein